MAVGMLLAQLLASFVAATVSFALAKSGKAVWRSILGFVLGLIVGWLAGFFLGIVLFKAESAGVQMRAMGATFWTALLFSSIGVFQGRKRFKSGGELANSGAERTPDGASIRSAANATTQKPRSLEVGLNAEFAHATPSPSQFVTPANTYMPPDTAADEDHFYGIVANELETGNTDKGLWTRLYAEHDGDEKKTKIAYIKRRVDQMLSLEARRKNELIRDENEKSIREQKVAAEIKLKSKGERRMQVLAEISKTKLFDECVDKIRLKSESPALEELLMGEPLWAEAVDSNGNTLLHFAVRNRNMHAVQLLLRYEADPNVRNSRGTTPKMEAESMGMYVFGE